jgi:hypothetical protein
MDDGSISHWPKPYLLLSGTCDEILSWMIENWMKNHLVSDNNCSIAHLNSLKKLCGMINNFGLTFSVGDTLLWFTLSIEKDS